MLKPTNGVEKLGKYFSFIISIVTIISLLIGSIVGMTIKSNKIEEAYTISKRNELSIQELREIMIRIDENMKYIRTELENLRKTK